MADNIEQKIKSYRTAPFDARFPNTNQTRNCFQNYLGEYVLIVFNQDLLFVKMSLSELQWNLQINFF